MSFVKLDADILTSSLWLEPAQRIVFITALLLAMPHYVEQPCRTIKIRGTDRDDFVVQPGDYGLVRAAGVAILRAAMVEGEDGLAALEALASPDPHSRTPEFDGRRMVRIDGGFLILNYDRYRSRDHSAADRARRYRERLKGKAVTRDGRDESSRVTQAEAEVEVEAEQRDSERDVRATAASRLTFSQFAKRCRESRESLFSDYPPLQTYVQSVGLPENFVGLAATVFAAEYGGNPNKRGKKYLDWRAAFLNAVKAGGWPRLWFMDRCTGQWTLNTEGYARQRELQAVERATA